MLRKLRLFFGVILATNLALACQAPAQTSSTNETDRSKDRLFSTGALAPSKAPVVPSVLPEWERRFFEIVSQPDAQQEELLREVAATVPEDQIHGALDQLVEQKAGPAMILAVFLGQRWAEKSPGDAAQWAAAHMSDDLFGRNLFGKIMVLWADQGLSDAVAWLQNMSAGGNKEAAAMALATEAARLGQAVTAINLATNISFGPERDSLLCYAAQHWAATDRDDATAWIKKVPDPMLREKMLGQVAVNLGAQDPAAGAKFVSTMMSDGQERDDAMATVIRFWGASAPADAAAWVKQYPDGPLHDLALENLMNTWGRENLTEASQWLNELPAGHSRNIAANALAHLAK